jgi:hypothetical protein
MGEKWTKFPHADKAEFAWFEVAAAWADEGRSKVPKDANAHYLHAFALGPCGQAISAIRTPAQAGLD